MNHTAEYPSSLGQLRRVPRGALHWIKALKLMPHPEGGYYRETYRSSEQIAKAHLPERYSGSRSFSTSIYFLLRGGQFSAFHRLKSDEIWHFYAGAPVEIFILHGNGALKKIKLGLNPGAGEQPQFVIEANSWFAAALINPKSAIQNLKLYALLGCTVAPGFDFADFELGRRTELLKQFPRHRALIEQFTNQPK